MQQALSQVRELRAELREERQENQRLRAALERTRERGTGSTLHVEFGEPETIPLDEKSWVSIVLNHPEGQTDENFESHMPIYDITMNTNAENVTFEEYAHIVVNYGYQYVLRKVGAEEHRDDMGRIVLRSTQETRTGKNLVVSTPSVPISELSSSLTDSCERSSQSSEEFSVTGSQGSIRIDMQIRLERRGNAVSFRVNKFEAADFFRNRVLQRLYGFTEEEEEDVPSDECNICMLQSIVCSAARVVSKTTGTVDPWTNEEHAQRFPYSSYLVYGGLFQPLECVWRTLSACQRKAVLRQYTYRVTQMAFLLHDELHAMGGPETPANAQDWTEKQLMSLAAQHLGIRIHIMSRQCGGKQVAVYGDFAKHHTHIYLYKDGFHYFGVRNIRALAREGKQKRGSSHWCDYCLKIIQVTNDENASNRMRSHIVKCLNTSIANLSQDRHHTFKMTWTNLFEKPRMLALRENEQPHNPRKYCKTCDEVLEDEEEHPENHDIDFFFVGKCACGAKIPYGKSTMTEDYYHYLNRHICKLRVKELKIGSLESYWAWDMECFMGEDIMKTQPETETMTMKQHIPIYIAVENLATDAFYDFEGENCVEKFCKMIFTKQEFQKATFLSHNGKTYDTQFIVRWLESHGQTPTIHPGPTSLHHVFQMDFEGRRFIDSLNFIPTGLGNFGKTFGLEQGKDFFPHGFSKRESLDYEGEMPDPRDPEDFYSLQFSVRGDNLDAVETNFSSRLRDIEKEREKFWHPILRPSLPKWKFMEQLKKYCKKDVKVLKQGCVIYRAEFMEDNSQDGESCEGWIRHPVDPFQYMTGVQCCNDLLLYGLPKGVNIVHTPRKSTNPSSRQCLEWLLFQESRLRLIHDPEIHIFHAYNRHREWWGEHNAPLDGYAEYFCPIMHTRHRFVLQFQGCYWHGCMNENCTQGGSSNPDAEHPHFRIPWKDVAARSDTRLKKLRQVYNRAYDEVIVIRACEWEAWKSMMEIPPMMKELARPMSDRDFFFGGRVEVFKPLVEADLSKGEEVRYIDIVSHYPNMCANSMLCTGHPALLLGDQIDVSRCYPSHPNAYFGFFRGVIRPNKGDMYGGLPRRDEHTQSLVFDNIEREVCGFLPELWDRLENGATIVKMFEVHDFDENNRSVGKVFRGYMNHFMRDKNEASGWADLGVPGGDVSGMSVEEKMAICENVAASSGGLGKPRWDKVGKNPGKRMNAKIKVNSSWGKFVQSDNESAKQYVTSLAEYDTLLENPLVDQSTLIFRRIGEEENQIFEARYGFVEQGKTRNRRVNTYLGASVTGWARVFLQKKIREVDAAYCDTDSVIYLHKPGETPLPTANEGSGLGQWKSELGDGEKGVAFYALGPKSYCFEYQDSEAKKHYKLKCKGVTFSYKNRTVLTPEIFRDRVIRCISNPRVSLSIPTRQFRICMNHYRVEIPQLSLVSMTLFKSLRPYYGKRGVLNPPPDDEDGEANTRKLKSLLDTHQIQTLYTLPFGYALDPLPPLAEDNAAMYWEVFYAAWEPLWDALRAIQDGEEEERNKRRRIEVETSA